MKLHISVCDTVFIVLGEFVIGDETPHAIGALLFVLK
jgi:hypothetical protein